VSLLTWFVVYKNANNGELSTQAQKNKNPLWKMLDSKYGVDELYNSLFAQGGRRAGRFAWRFVDLRMVDGIGNGLGRLVGLVSYALRGWQSGLVRNYALSMLIGAVLVVLFCLMGIQEVTR